MFSHMCGAIVSGFPSTGSKCLWVCKGRSVESLLGWFSGNNICFIAHEQEFIQRKPLNWAGQQIALDWTVSTHATRVS